MYKSTALRLLAAFSLTLLFHLSHGQKASTAEEVLAAAKAHSNLRASTLLGNWKARQIGPQVQGGRIVDLEVHPQQAGTWYIAYASGGLWRTTNNGQSFEPIFDNQLALGIGDIAICQSQPNVIWLGSGENNSSRSSYAGVGMFRSVDGGENWQHLGLAETQHIGRVIAHPTDPNTAWAAAIGPLYTESPDRGLYKTTDGGQTWKKTLFVDDRTGIIDLVIDPQNPKTLYAAAWERLRKAWDFDGDGPGSGIYKSVDGGDTWTLSMNGIPKGEHTGRLGLAISPSQPNTLYAFLDNQEVDESLLSEDTIAGITSRMITDMDKAGFLQLDSAKLDSFLRGKGYPEKYTGERVQKDVEEGKYEVSDIATYFGDANDALFRTGVKGAEVYRSDDGGKSWKMTHSEPLTGVSYTYGYYFGQIRVAPQNPDQIYITGVPLLQSSDGGAKWSRVDTFDIHVDHHALWISAEDENHMILGNDGGLYISYDKGIHWTHLNNVPVGQFYTVHVDMAEPYNVYGGLQDNGVKKGSSRSVPNRTKEWENVFGGDGMFIVTDEKNPGLVYTGFQFGNYFRIDKGRYKRITPSHDIGEPAYRWNWRTPLRQSPHNHEILYFGNQYLMRSMDKGDNWEKISPDLTSNKEDQGNVPYSTISTISESPKKFGLIWVGTDDGRIQVTTDGGNTWSRVDGSLPQKLWVSKVTASPHDQNTAFVSLTGYRDDDFHTYVYQTSDLGKTWQSLQGNLPQEPVNVIIQDPVWADLLYLGTDHGTYVSWNRGEAWQYLSQLPNVASYDMVVHPRDMELVVGTHGRSIFVLDVAPLQALQGREKGQALVVNPLPEIRWRKDWGEKSHPWSQERRPGIELTYFVDGTDPAPRTVGIRVLDADGKAVYSVKQNAQPGLNAWTWDLDTDGSSEKSKFLKPGSYKVELKLNFETRSTQLEVKDK